MDTAMVENGKIKPTLNAYKPGHEGELKDGKPGDI
jgi:hypothetical protein